MENQRVSVPLRGIVKDKPQLQSADGDCEEIINLRFIDNAWRGVGAKDRLPYSIVSTKIYSKLISPYILPDGTFVGFCSSDNSVYLIVTDGDNESNEQLLVTLGSGDVFKSFAWLNNTLIVYSYNNLVYLQYLPNSGTFIVLPDLAMPKLAIGESSPVKLFNYQNPDGINVGLDPIAFESYLQYTASQLQVKYALARSDGYFHGNVSFYFAYRLFDGSYIKHSGPYIWNVAWDINMRPFLKRYKIDGVLDYWETGIYLNFPTAYLEFNTQQLSTINDYNKAGIIQSLCIFMSSTKETYNIGAELSEWNVFHESGSYYYYPPLNDDAKIDISDVANHFLVKELTINELIDNSTSGAVRREVIVLKDNELSTIETNPVMPIDNFSIHKLIPSTHYQYNSRLHLGDLKIIMGDMPSPFIPHFFDTLTSSRVTIAERNTSLEDHYFDNNDIVTDNSPLNGMDLYLHAELLSDGKRYMTLKKLDNAEISLYHKNVGGADEYSMPLRPLFGYPDTRAVKFSLLANKPSQGTHFRVVSSPAINGSKATALLIIYDNYDSSGICSIVAGTTIQIGNTTLTCVGIGATPGDYEFNENASIPTTRNNILACIAAMPTVGTVFWVASAGAYSNTIDFIARQTGEQSNTYTTKVLPSQGTRFQESTFVGGSDTFDSLKSFPLSKVLFQNVSLYDGPLQSIVDGAYLPIWLKIPVENTDYNKLPIYDEPIAWVNDWQEPNRIQVSEVNNLFLYPAKQSYRVGNPDYTIRAMIVAQEPLTEMQFGQFPLYTFTAGGVYALEYGGGGEVLYSRITQFLTDVIREGAIPVALAGGAIVYQELSAVKVLIGREAKDISRPVIVNSKNPIYLDAHLVNMTDNPELSELRAVLDDPASTMQMDDFILNSLIGYDHTRKEILFTNGNYTLVYQLISGAWYKRTDMFDNYLHETGGHLGMVREVAGVTDVDIHKYGLLYNWYAATDVRKITSSDDWVIPTITQWNTFSTYIGGNTIGGGKLKEIGFTYWNSPNTSATNEYNFNGRGAGYRDGGVAGDFKGLSLKTRTYFIVSNYTYGGRTLNYNNDDFNLASIGYQNNWGFSIRAMRSATVEEQLLADGTACDLYEGNDGKLYRTVKIGTQVWLADNLAETKYRNGDAIPEVTDNAAWAALETGALCAYDNDWSNAFTTEEETTFRTSFYKLSSEVETAEGEQSIMQKPWIFAQTRPFSLGQLSYKHIERIIARFMGVNFVVREIDHIEVEARYGALYNQWALIDAAEPEPALELTFDDIANVPVADASSVSDWNTFFDLPTNGNPFTSVGVVGNMVRLTGGSGITIKDSLFNSDAPIVSLISIDDKPGCIIATGYTTFASLSGESILITANFPALVTIGEYCFYRCHSLVTFDFSAVQLVGTSSFVECFGLVNPSFPSLITANNAAFHSCIEMINPSFPLLEFAGVLCFNNCKNLVNPSFPSLITAEANCFKDCKKLNNPNLPALVTAGDGCFYGSEQLAIISMPVAQNIVNACFYICPALNTINIPMVINLGSSTGNNLVFGVSGQTITLTIPSALMTCNGGNPDGDIQWLIDNNTVTIITV